MVKNSEVRIVLGKLLGLEEKNPVAFEVSRAIKALQDIAAKLEERKLELMSQYLVRDNDGNYSLTEDTERAIAEAREQGTDAVPTVFAFEVEEGKEEEYREKMTALLEEKVDISFRGVDCLNRKIRDSDGNSVSLTQVLSNHFGSGEINFLEEIGILTNLD